MKNMFEQKICETIEKNSTYLAWKKNILVKPKEFSSIPAHVASSSQNSVNPLTEKLDYSSSGNSMDITVKTSPKTPKISLESANDKNDSSDTNIDDDCQETDNCNSWYEINTKSIGKERVSKLKYIYENAKKTAKEKHTLAGVLSETVSLSNLKNMNRQVFSQEDRKYDDDEFEKVEEAPDNNDGYEATASTRSRRSSDEPQVNEFNSGDNLFSPVERTTTNIGNEKVSKLKNIYEDMTNKTKDKNARKLRLTVSLSNLVESDPDHEQDTIEMEYDDHGNMENGNIERDAVDNHEEAVTDDSDGESESEGMQSKQADADKNASEKIGQISVKELASKFSAISNDKSIKVNINLICKKGFFHKPFCFIRLKESRRRIYRTFLRIFASSFNILHRKLLDKVRKYPEWFHNLRRSRIDW